MTYRYRSKAALWWLSRGEDIDIASLPNLPGKAIQFELTTTTISGLQTHDVNVDLGQLWEYLQWPLRQQPFYVFPHLDWTGTLEQTARHQALVFFAGA